MSIIEVHGIQIVQTPTPPFAPTRRRLDDGSARLILIICIDDVIVKSVHTGSVVEWLRSKRRRRARRIRDAIADRLWSRITTTHVSSGLAGAVPDAVDRSHSDSVLAACFGALNGNRLLFKKR